MTDAELDFLARYDASAFPHPSVAVDVVVLTIRGDEDHARLSALLIRRDAHPFLGAWTLPGGFVGMREAPSEAAERVLRDKAGLEGAFVEQLAVFGAPDRDPRTRVITLAHLALLPAERAEAATLGRWLDVVVPWAGETGGPVELHDEGTAVTVGFDHAAIVGEAVRRLRGKVDYTNVAFSFLPPRFTLRAVQRVHEAVLGRALNKDAFRRKLLAAGLVAPTGEHLSGLGHRPPELYTFTGVVDPVHGRR